MFSSRIKSLIEPFYIYIYIIQYNTIYINYVYR